MSMPAINIKKIFWNVLGFVCLGLAYIGVIVPGFPYSIWIVAAAYCFSKGSERMHRWLYNHKIFGPFLTNWNQKRVFPIKMKYFMLGMMGLSLILMYTGGVKSIGIISTAVLMTLVAVWAWRYPSSVEEWHRRKDNGEKIGWLK
jgi:uncharacterized membrane protein YbaN (DUF454 family)